MDPPAWGIGAKGEKWKLEDKIDELLCKYFVIYYVEYPGEFLDVKDEVNSDEDILINVIRIVSLTISQYNNGEFVKLEQHDFYNYIDYVLIFILWVVWVKFVVPESDVFSPKNNSDSKSKLT